MDDSDWAAILESGNTVWAPLYYRVWDIERIPPPQSVLDASKRDGRVRLIDLIKRSKNATSIEDCCNAGILPMAFKDYYNADGTKRQLGIPGFMMTTQAAPGEEGDASVDEELHGTRPEDPSDDWDPDDWGDDEQEPAN
jgi:hypothetical protein